jgi:predicted enzyme related to lactoylglutathione lyase
MITGTHIVFYSEDADADRAFFQDILKLSAVDAGGGWLIFALPPAEAGIHPTEGKAKDGGRSQPGAVVYLMCDDLKAEMKRLKAKKVSCFAAATERWGIRTTLRLPSGAELGLYQPTHPTAIGLKSKTRAKSTAIARSR